MIKLSQEVQRTVDGLSIERSPVTRTEESQMLDLVMGKINNQASDTAATERGRRLKPVYLIAAILSVIGLLGAGYASVYFSRLYVPGDSPVDYDIAVHNPELLIEAPVFGEVDPGSSRQIVEVEGLGVRDLELLFAGKRPGELLDLELHAPDGKMLAHGITGNGLNMLYSISDIGAPGGNLLLNRERAPSTQQVINSVIADGEFIATIDSTKYTPVHYQYGTFPTLTYRDGEGATVTLTFERLLGKSEMPRETYENATSEDWLINGHTFVYSDLGFTSILDLYLGEAEMVDRTMVSIHYQRGSREQYAEVANSLILHNAEGNSIILPDTEFFADFPQPDVRADAAVIASAVRNYRGEDAVSDSVWEKGGTIVRSAEGGRRFFIDMGEAFRGDSPSYPYSTHTPIAGMSWFPKEELTRLTIAYENAALASCTYTNSDATYAFSSEYARNGYIRSPLDAVLAKMDQDYQLLEPMRLVDGESESPILVARQVEGDLAYVYSALRISDGNILVQRLCMPMDALPEDLIPS